MISAFAKGDLDRAEDVLAEHVLRMRLRYRSRREREPAGARPEGLPPGRATR